MIGSEQLDLVWISVNPIGKMFRVAKIGTPIKESRTIMPTLKADLR
jgi:hypothetical protein